MVKIKLLLTALLVCLPCVAGEPGLVYFSAELLHGYKTVMFVIDPESGAILERSGGALAYYGYDEMIGMNIAQINTLSGEEIAVEMRRAEMEKRNYFLFRHRLADGSIRDVEVNAYPMIMKGKTVLVSRIRDVTEELVHRRLRFVFVLTGFIALLMVIALISVLLVRLRKEKSRALLENREKSRLLSELEHTQAELRKQLKEKDVLLREVHHRIKNNIFSIETLLVLQSRSVESSEAQSVLQSAVSRVQGMRVLYQKLLGSGSYTENSVRHYIESLVDSIRDVFPESQTLCIDMRLQDFQLSADRLFPLGIIVNELLTNIMKHAFEAGAAGHISLSLEKNEGTVILEMRDNGRGLPENFDLSSAEGFGLMIVKMLAQQLDGRFEMYSEGGTVSRLTFSL